MGSGRQKGDQRSRQRTRVIACCGAFGLAAAIAYGQRASLVNDELEIEARSGARNFAPALSADGGRHAYLSQRPGAPAVLMIHSDSEGREERQLAPYLPPMERLRWSPDGTQLLIGGGGLFLINLDDPETIQTVVAGTADGDWSADGKAIYYIHRRTEVRAHPLSGAEPETVIAKGRGDDLRGLIAMRGGGPIAWIEGPETVVIRYVVTNKTIRLRVPGGVRQIEWCGDDLLALVGSGIRLLAWNGRDKDSDLLIPHGETVTSFTVYRREVKVNEPQPFDDNYFRFGPWSYIIMAQSRILRLLP